MYNGVGVPTARGTGTNGYVQKNLSFISKPVTKSAYNDKDRLKKMLSNAIKEPNKEILEHERKRKLEVQCVEYEMELEEKGMSREEIDDLVDKKRKQLWTQYYDEENKTVVVDGSEISYKEYMEKIETEAKNKKMRKAFGLTEEHERSSFFGQERPQETGLPPPSRGLIPKEKLQNDSPQEKFDEKEMNKMLSSSDDESPSRSDRKSNSSPYSSLSKSSPNRRRNVHKYNSTSKVSTNHNTRTSEGSIHMKAKSSFRDQSFSSSSENQKQHNTKRKVSKEVSYPRYRRSSYTSSSSSEIRQRRRNHKRSISVEKRFPSRRYSSSSPIRRHSQDKITTSKSRRGIIKDRNNSSSLTSSSYSPPRKRSSPKNYRKRKYSSVSSSDTDSYHRRKYTRTSKPKRRSSTTRSYSSTKRRRNTTSSSR